MSKPFAQWDDRTQTLAIEEVTSGLSRVDHAELLALVRAFEDADAREMELFERSAAAIHVAGALRVEAPPMRVVERLQRDADSYFARNPALLAEKSSRTAARRPRMIIVGAGWLAAAILLAMFVLQRPPNVAPDAASGRRMLVADARDAVITPWTASTDPLAQGLSGDVVWSRSRQAGFLRFEHLAPNDPTRAQYQLWIFDKARDAWDTQPVDGGVFDVRSSEESVVAIDAKLDVRDAVLFAVTLERPGGVVVSKREHLLATATPQ